MKHKMSFEELCKRVERVFNTEEGQKILERLENKDHQSRRQALHAKFDKLFGSERRK